jgi:hypothetical protein
VGQNTLYNVYKLAFSLLASLPSMYKEAWSKEMFALPFHEYIAYRTKFAVERVKASRVMDMEYGFLSLLQAMWAREYWFSKVEGEVK